MEQFDTHLHLTDPRLWQSIDAELQSCLDLGITGFLNAGFNKEDWERQRLLQGKWSGVGIYAWGLHPYWINENTEHPQVLEEEFGFLQEHRESFQAIGETGFDLRPKFKSSFDLQERFFRKHIALHLETNKPLILHLVRANNEAVRILKSFGSNFTGIVHSFSGNLKEANKLIELGFKISFSGGVTNPNSSRIRETAKKIDIHSLLIETDSPDQKPSHFDEELNHPWALSHIAEEIAILRKTNAQEILEASNRNFKNLFNL